jgi:DNA-binding FrmR family transcriptional regulator
MSVSSPLPSDTVLAPEDKKRLIDRLARVEGQLRGVQKMIAQDRECEVIAQQISAARGALEKAFSDQIGCAIGRRLAQSGVDTPKARQAVKEILELMTRYS